MSELLRVLAEEDVDDEALQEAAAAAHAVLETRDIGVEGVAPVLHEDARDAGQRAIDEAVDGRDAPRLTLVLSPPTGTSRRLRIRPHPDPGLPALLREDEQDGCSWRTQGSEALEGVEIDGDVWHEADADGVEPEVGP
ncbi:hypothetical protein [Halolamina rubra]|uniref:hypothetical protein n=1 Tax=Halolamina rubra TaxID=1380430 RepID=UPI000679BB63|nr:hypothetical protein [Halolamina rubra]